MLKQADEVAGYVSQVSGIADGNRKTFGFLSASAYEQMASKGQLWVAINDARELKGYLMFGGTMPTLKVFQVYACKTVRGHGVGKKLIDELKIFARERSYHSITARVASDLPANNFWDRNGFLVYRQEKGGETTGRVINIRGYSLDENDLFGCLNRGLIGVQPTGPVLERPIYALDLNLLIDVFRARSGYRKVVKIMQIGFQGGFSICITPEFKKELERQSSNFSDDPILRLAEVFPELKTDFDVSVIVESLRQVVFPLRTANRKSAQNDESDLKHLAYCISAGIGGFITREKALLRACDEIKGKYGVAILSPDEIVLEDSDGDANIEVPLNSDFSFAISSVTDEVRRFLRDLSAPENIINMLDSASPIKTEQKVYEARLDSCLFGVYFFQSPIKATGSAVAILYVDEECPQAIAAIDHFLEMALRHKSNFPYRLDLYIGKGQDLTEETLLKKGFFKSNNCFMKIIINTFLDGESWTDFARSVKSFCGFSLPERFPLKRELRNTGVCFADAENKVEAFSWFDFETIIGPRFVLTADRECILVPIQENFANGLIGNVKNQLSLLSTHDKILLLEKAYFRSPVKASLFEKGGIVAFYVSGSKSIQEIIGFARITYSDVVGVDEAMIKLDRQGVLSREELIGVAKGTGKIHVFTFDNFLEFDSRVPFSKAKKLGLISDANLVSPEKIGIKQFRILIGQAFDD
ncbi:GNAT family N-acetyltransferase [Pseudomonas aeruginosa]|nr:GNAT family N-acetyltransferase [Pseudomonas aeruginosa]MDI3696495.1 GNAT family N-acetyltransferase [Pseudomonas aeruginosa]MDI3901270.1 GNAT family N-acetyltransferase [Pseudomonas aeruginosa]